MKCDEEPDTDGCQHADARTDPVLHGPPHDGARLPRRRRVPPIVPSSPQPCAPRLGHRLRARRGTAPEPRVPARSCGRALRAGDRLLRPGDRRAVRRGHAAPIPWDDRPKRGRRSGARPHLCAGAVPRVPRDLHEKVPVLYSPEACSTAAMEYGRIREGYALDWRWVQRTTWRRGGGMRRPAVTRSATSPTASPRRTVATSIPSAAASTPTARRSTACRSPSSTSRPRRDGTTCRIDICSGRRSIAQAREHLTHICWISWPHGGVVKAERAARRCKSASIARCGRRNTPSGPARAGSTSAPSSCSTANSTTSGRWRISTSSSTGEPPYLSADGRTAVYEIRKPPPIAATSST